MTKPIQPPPEVVWRMDRNLPINPPWKCEPFWMNEKDEEYLKARDAEKAEIRKSSRK